MERNKTVVLLSGGLDSATCLALAVRDYGKDNVIALTMHYGQRHANELECAKQLAKYYGVKHIMKDLSVIFTDSNSAMLAHGEAVKHTSYKEQLKEADGQEVNTYVPFRNGVFLSVAAAIAYAEGANSVMIGAHLNDSSGGAYPDCSYEFVKHMHDAIFLGTGKKVIIVSPFVHHTKAEIVEFGLELNVPYALTWSCYSPVELEGEIYACGTCGTCRDRINAFVENEAEDPIVYID